MYSYKFWSLTLLAVLLSHSIFSQKNYIVVASSIQFGKKFIKGNAAENAQSIKVKEKGQTVSYTPYDIIEFGFRDGRVFHSFTIDADSSSSRYFFERIFKGRYHVYYLKNKSGHSGFYITSHDSLPLKAIPQERESYTEFLRDYVRNCTYATNNLKHITLNKNRLSRFFEDYQSCSGSHLPRFRYGLKTGLSLYSLVPDETSILFATPTYRHRSGFF